MASSLDPSHPKQKLFFFAAEDLDDTIRAKIRDFVLRLASLRSWLNGPARFVHDREQPTDVSGGDKPVETVGGYLEIYSALPPLTLPREIDLQHFDEVRALVDEVSAFSQEHCLAFAFQLDETFVGSVIDGEMDRLLAEGLLVEWERQLSLRR